MYSTQTVNSVCSAAHNPKIQASSMEKLGIKFVATHVQKIIGKKSYMSIVPTQNRKDCKNFYLVKYSTKTSTTIISTLQTGDKNNRTFFLFQNEHN